MSVRLELEGSAHLDDLIAFAQQGVGWRRFHARREEIRRQHERSVKRVLGVYPPRRNLSQRFVWSHDKAANDRARRWFFAHYPNGYTRTGNLGKGWKTRMSLTRAGFTLSAENEAKAAQFVYQTDAGRQLPGHATTGWLDARDEFLDVAVQTEKAIIAALDAFIEEII